MNWTWLAPRTREVPEVLSGGYGEDVDGVVRLCVAMIAPQDSDARLRFSGHEVFLELERLAFNDILQHRTRHHHDYL